MTRPLLCVWLGWCALKLILSVFGSAALWTWVLYAAVAAVIWIEEPSWLRGGQP